MQPFDWGLLLAFALGIIAGLHFIVTQQTAPVTAIEQTIFQAHDTAQALAEGYLYPRWSPDALGGYGAPIPIFLPPAPGYTAGALTILFTGDPVIGARSLFALMLGLASAAMYLFIRRVIDAHAGWLAAALYVFNPLLSLDTAVISGDLYLLMSLVLLPAWLWAMLRAHQTRRPLNLLWLVGIGAGLILTHPVFALVAAGISLAYSGWAIITKRTIQNAILVLAAVILAAGLSSFFWLPAALESSAVRWQPAFTPDWANPINWLLPLRPIDPLVANPLPQFAPGWLMIAFALGGLVTALLEWRRHRLAVALAAGGLLIAILLPWLPFPFPPHLYDVLLALTSLALAGLGAQVMRWRSRLLPRWQRLPLSALLILIWIGSIPIWLPPHLTRLPVAFDDGSQIAYELQGYGIAGLPPDQAVPKTIAPDLPPNEGLIQGYQRGAVNKLVPSQFTADLQAALLDHNTHSDRFQLRATRPSTLAILTACYPGWEAWLGESRLPLTCNPDTGLLELPIPEATGGELVIQMGTTPVRAAGWTLSGLSLGLAVMVTIIRLRRWTDPFENISLLPIADARLTALALLASGALTYWLHQPNAPLDLRPQPGFVAQAVSPAGFRSDTGIILLGFQQSSSRISPADRLDITLHWGTGRELTENYRARLILVNVNTDQEWILTPFQHPGGFPTRRWLTGLTVLDRYQLRLPELIPTGRYQIGLELNDCTPTCEVGGSVTFFNVDGSALGTIVRLPAPLIVE